METYVNTNEKLRNARKQVKRIKGFYIHALVYVLVNMFIIFTYGFVAQNGFEDFDSYKTAIFWGFGLIAHGMSVFGSEMFLGPDWEERKSREMMNK